MRILVLGGTGFIGRHVVAAARASAHEVIVGTRDPARAPTKFPSETRGCALRGVRFERLIASGLWDLVLKDIEVVVNCVGILRPRGRETYERVHHLAPAALVKDCSRMGLRRFIHVSALGLRADASSGFLTSKLNGERAVAASGLDWSIVRPSLLDGEDGFGARWVRMMAHWPVHFVPADARGRIATLDVGELGEAIAHLCETSERHELREVELGGLALRTMGEQLAALRRQYHATPAFRAKVPARLAKIVAHICDLFHFSPFSLGHLELLRRDNAPRVNALPYLLKRMPKAIGIDRREERGRIPEPRSVTCSPR